MSNFLTINEISGFLGYTTDGHGGTTNENGEVTKVIFGITFPHQTHDVNVNISKYGNEWGAMMGNGKIIPLINPQVLSTTNECASIIFDMVYPYASNSPATLTFVKDNAWIDIKQKEELSEVLPNRFTPYSGYVTSIDGAPADDNGYVTNVIFTINYPERDSDIDIMISDSSDFKAAMPDGTIQNLSNGTVIGSNRSTGIIRFDLETPYPENSPCTLLYSDENSSIELIHVENKEYSENTLSGFFGITLKGTGNIDKYSNVNKIRFNITFRPMLFEPHVSISNGTDHWLAKTSENKYIKLLNPKTLFSTKYSSVIEFDLEDKYPSNSLMMLVYAHPDASIVLDIDQSVSGEILPTDIVGIPDKIYTNNVISLQTNAIVFPTNASNQTIYCSCDDPDVILSSNDLLIINVAKDITITAKIYDNNHDVVFTKDFDITSSSHDVVITNQPPFYTVIEQGSVNNVLSCEGECDNDSVVYQWFVNTTTDIENAAEITNATSKTYTIPNTTISGKYFYFCKVSSHSDPSKFEYTIFSEVLIHVPVTGVKLNKNNLVLKGGGDVVELTATIEPSNASNKNVKWITEDDSKLYVSQGGMVKSMYDAGSFYIEVETEDGSFKDRCNITIEEYVPITNISNIPERITAGTEIILNPIIDPPNATYQDIKYTIVNGGGSILDLVDNRLTCTQLSGGEFCILNLCVDNGLSVDSPYDVDFRIILDTDFYPVKALSINRSYLELDTEHELIGYTAPSGATKQDIIWEVVDPGVSGLEIRNGNIAYCSGSELGNVIIKATIIDGISDGVDFVKEITIPVYNKFTPVADIGNIPSVLYTNTRYSLKPSILPENSSATNYIINIENHIVKISPIEGYVPEIIFNSDNTIEVQSKHDTFGSFDIIITVKDGLKPTLNVNPVGIIPGINYSKTVNVKYYNFNAISDVTIDPLLIYTGETLPIVPTIQPSGASVTDAESYTYTITDSSSTTCNIDKDPETHVSYITALDTSIAGPITVELEVIGALYPPPFASSFKKTFEIDVEIFVPVENINGMVDNMIIGNDYSIDLSIYPDNTTKRNVELNIFNYGNTGATMSIDAGVITVTDINNIGIISGELRVTDGVSRGVDFVKPFAVLCNNFIPVTSIELPFPVIVAGREVDNDIVIIPNDATYSNVKWSITEDNGTNSTIVNNKIIATDPGNFTVNIEVTDALE